MEKLKKDQDTLCGFAAHELHESRKFILQYKCDNFFIRQGFVNIPAVLLFYKKERITPNYFLKFSNIISKLSDNFSVDLFEVLHIYVGQKITI